MLEHDAEMFVGTEPRLGHQRERVGGRGLAGVLDEVRVAGRDRARRRWQCPAGRTPRACGPRESSCSGFLKTLPKVRLFVGWAALRWACISATVALISSAGRGVQPELDAGDHLPVRAGPSAGSESPSSAGVSQPGRRP